MLETPNLRLVPCSPEHLLTLIEQPERFEEHFGFRPARGYREFFVSGEVSPIWLAGLHASTGVDPWVYGFAVVHPDQGLVIGSCGFKGPPDPDGVVEIAYGIVPDFEGRGYGTEAASALLEFAFQDERVRLVRAHTSPLATASPRILEKCGFSFVGQIVDPDDGLVSRWERVRHSARFARDSG